MKRNGVKRERHAGLLVSPLPVSTPGDAAVLLLKDVRVLAVVDLRLVEAVLLHLVDEEEREHLYAALVEPQLTVEVILDGLSDLRPLH